MNKPTLALVLALSALFPGGCFVDGGEVALFDDCVSLCEDADDRGCNGVDIDCEQLCAHQEEIGCDAEYVDVLACLDEGFQSCGVEVIGCEQEKAAYKECLAPHVSQPGS